MSEGQILGGDTHMMTWKGPPRIVCPKYREAPTLKISGIWEDQVKQKGNVGYNVGPQTDTLSLDSACTSPLGVE